MVADPRCNLPNDRQLRVIALDTNILVYAHRQDSPWHERAYRCIEHVAESGRSWAIAWPCIHEFVAIVTHPRIYDPPTPSAQALDQLQAWSASPGLLLLGETDDHLDTLSKVLTSSLAVGPKVHDARVAAICLDHGVSELWSADRDFSRFAQLQTINPLVDERFENLP